MSDTEKFIFAKWPVEVHRRPFRRSVSINMSPRKPIKVIASKTTSQKAILDFLLAKKDWIEKNFEKFDQYLAKNPEKKIISAETFPFLGKELPLKVVITFQKKPFVSVTDENLLLHIPRNDWSADSILSEHPYALKCIREFYKREAIKMITHRVALLVTQTGLQPSEVKFREPKTRWGSCNSKRVINLNWRLIVFEPGIIDYVIIHELSHLRHMNHSSAFWGLVEEHCPEYRMHVKALKEQQGKPEFLTEAKP